MAKYLLALIALSSLSPAAELILADGSAVSCGEEILSKETPLTFVTTKTGNDTRVYKLSQVKLTALPEAMLAEWTPYQQAQLKKRLIVKDDKWIHRDEMLLKQDPRYAYAKPLGKVGDSIIDFINTTDRIVTIGIRSGDKGYEIHIEAGKKKGYQVPDGAVSYVMAQESDDGTALVVQASKPVALKHVHYQVTIVKTDEIPAGEMGVIPIPREYQVHD